MSNIHALDAAQLKESASLVKLCFGESLKIDPEIPLAASLSNYPYKPKTFVALNGHRVVGLIQSLTGYIHPNMRTFSFVCVHPDYQKQGIGRSLIEYAEDDAIRNHFNGEAGTFMLVSAYEGGLYRNLGYERCANMHDGYPLMMKSYVPI